MSGREALEAANNALLQDEHTSTHLNTTLLVPLASYAYTQSYSWWDFQVNILAKLRIPPSPPPPLFSSLKILLPSHPLLPSSPPPLKTLTCMPLFPTVGNTGGESQFHSNYHVSVSQNLRKSLNVSASVD